MHRVRGRAGAGGESMRKQLPQGSFCQWQGPQTLGRWFGNSNWGTPETMSILLRMTLLGVSEPGLCPQIGHFTGDYKNPSNSLDPSIGFHTWGMHRVSLGCNTIMIMTWYQHFRKPLSCESPMNVLKIGKKVKSKPKIGNRYALSVQGSLDLTTRVISPT